MRRLSRLAPWLGALAVAVAYWAPMWKGGPGATGFGDWQFFHHLWEASYVAYVRHGQVPLWDPYQCGGVTLWGNPQFQALSPLFFVSFLTGTTVATKIFLLVHCIAGFAGMYLLARRDYRLGIVPAALASMAWAGSGFFAWHGAGGHGTFICFWLAPWLILAWRRAARDPRLAVAFAGLIFLLLLEGATYALPYSALLLAFDTLVRWRRDRRGIVRAGLVAVPLIALLGAVRIIPIWITLHRHPRHLVDHDKLDFVEVIRMLTLHQHPWRFPPHEFVWPEYGIFIGWTIVLLAVAGAFVAWRRTRAPSPRRAAGEGAGVRLASGASAGHSGVTDAERAAGGGRVPPSPSEARAMQIGDSGTLRHPYRHVIAGALLFGAFMLGHRGSFYPWPIVNLLPVYKDLRVPSRFGVFFLFYVALLAGLALQALGEALSRYRLRRGLDWVRPALPILLVLVATADIWAATFHIVNRWDGPPIYDLDPVPSFHLITPHNFQLTYASLPQRHEGTAQCYEAMPWPVSPALWVGNVPQARIEGAASGQVLATDRTNNTAWAKVRLDAPGRVVFNQNFEPGWESSVGRVVPDKGRLAVDVPAGARRIVVRYAPSELPWAFGLTLLGILLAVPLAIFATHERFDRLVARLRRLLGLRRVG